MEGGGTCFGDAHPSRLRKTIFARQNIDSPHVWDKPGPSGYLVCLVSLIQPNKPDTEQTT
jgi:hypothetical protein